MKQWILDTNNFFGTKGTKNQSQRDLKNIKLYKANDPC